jgi:adenylate kinase
VDAGGLVPDELVFGLVVDALTPRTAAGEFILDGFPRTTPQAHALDSELERLERRRPRAILIEVPDAVLIGRLSGRRICAQHGHKYHVDYRPPTRTGICHLDGSPLVRRDDDEPATVEQRLAVYHDQTEPLIAYYEHRQRLRRVDGERDAAEIRSHLAALIARPWD